MSVWSDLAGQQSVVAHLQRALAAGRVPHAYLFSGPTGAPLVDTALALAMAMNCATADVRARGEACGECDQCSKIASGIHPDVVTLVREGAAQIVPIENVRTQVIARLGLPPHEARTRVFIVEEAMAFAPFAANTLLKTLEEPPARTLFVMCTTAPELLLPTIRSRCQRVRFAGGSPIASGDDPARAAKLVALAEELAADRHDPSLPQRIVEGKGDAIPVIVAAARSLHATACAAAIAGDAQRARRAATRAQAILSWHTAVAVHNANALLAVDALIAELHALPAAGATTTGPGAASGGAR